MSKKREIFNCSLKTWISPQIWNRVVVLPLKKAGKQPGTITPYRPVSLTSCVAKPMERIIHNRLYYLAENCLWPCHEQVGFRTSRSYKDQLPRVTQSISDGYQATTPKQAVWKEDLLLGVEDRGLPLISANDCVASS